MQRFIQQRSKKQLAGPVAKKGPASVAAYTSLLFLLILLTATFVSSLWSTLSTTNSKPTSIANQTIAAEVSSKHSNHTRSRGKSFEATLNCTIGNQTCSTVYPTTTFDIDMNEEVCPEYFRWIHEDLRSWKSKGISRGMVERARKTAHFRLVVKKGRAYVEKYKESIQTRDVFTIWGIVQLLRRYPGRVPDLELMFDCDDRPVIPAARDYHANITGPPPLFRYCGDRWTEDIVFPDWSFWGWAEINIRPWEHLLKDIKEGNKRIKWIDREPFAYWKGNPFVAENREDLLKCNASNGQDWNARLFVQDWIQESRQGFNQSNVANQCTYSLQPMQHYWPIRDNAKCQSIKHAVDWGNNHVQQEHEGEKKRKNT